MGEYVLGRGKIFFDQFPANSVISASTKGVGERYFGNTPELNLTQEASSLDHYSSDEGLRTKDKSVLLELNRTGSFITDHISAANIATWYLGQASTFSQAALTGQVSTFDAVLADHYYQIGTTTANPAGARKVASVVITDTDTPATTYVLGTHYTIDLDLARIYVIPGSGMVGKDITITYNTTAVTWDRVVTLNSSASIEGAMRFLGENAEGQKRDFFFPYVKITPTGDHALKGDDWQQLGFNVEFLKKATGVETLYVDNRPV